MGQRLQQLWSQLATFFVAQPPGRRVAIATVGLTSMAVVLGLAWWVQRPLMRPLFTNLSERDAGAIVEVLRTERVPFELENGGRAVLVPAEKLYELRLALASRGLPEGGGVGFELFDEQSLGQTDFLQRLNYQRALQGELGRTIGQLGGVEAARVHLALPERSLFVGADRSPSASVVVKLASGRSLARSQIDGIVHLVAASVEGMAAEDVTVVDEGGRMLTSDRSGGVTGLSGTALEHQTAVERQLEERVESMLGAVVGASKVIARVSARLDFSRVERTEETYDPEGTALRSERRTREETVGGSSTAGGAPGVQANLTNEAPATAESGPRTERRDETQSYEVSKIVSRTIGPVGVLEQLSVAVLVDGTYSGEGESQTFSPRPAEELQELRQLVESAVGFDEARGDRIEVTSVAFQATPVPEEEGMLGMAARWAPPVLTRLLGVVFAAVMLLWVVRPLVLGLAVRAPGGGGAGVPLTGPEAAMARLTQENLTLLQDDPARAARLVREWLSEGAPRIEQS